MFKQIFPDFERRSQPLAPPNQFYIRLVNSGLFSLIIITVSLIIGMAGYRIFEHLTWVDAFLNAAMLLGGMGPVDPITSFGGKVFAGIYSLYCGLMVLLVAGIIMAPVAHRILHRFHMEPPIEN